MTRLYATLILLGMGVWSARADAGAGARVDVGRWLSPGVTYSDTYGYGDGAIVLARGGGHSSHRSRATRDAGDGGESTYYVRGYDRRGAHGQTVHVRGYVRHARGHGRGRRH